MKSFIWSFIYYIIWIIHKINNCLEIKFFIKILFVLAAGTYPTHALPLQILANADIVVCCDSAAERFLAEMGIPNAIVGDGDSLPEELKQRYAHLWHPENEQETNDLSKAVRYLMRQG